MAVAPNSWLYMELLCVLWQRRIGACTNICVFAVVLLTWFLGERKELKTVTKICHRLCSFLINPQIAIKVLAPFWCLYLSPELTLPFCCPLLCVTFPPLASPSYCCFLETVGHFMGSNSSPFPSSTDILTAALHSSREKEALLAFMLFASFAVSEGLLLWLPQTGI